MDKSPPLDALARAGVQFYREPRLRLQAMGANQPQGRASLTLQPEQLTGFDTDPDGKDSSVEEIDGQREGVRK